ncbi:alkaline phosphatase D family protein [Candidatus Berkiella aquae]|uniref:Alkaline phosphatase D family protein n=1 Tax=Candidatus Berkiella aquae TaxID=295108 RepID=A0A0Q9Z0L1_9GAMM|nr:alkaline phosphatase D family protein [Candidatus Berkiella aquae]MCS5712074.1 alkaline phosphatase D family protein [Candidatus Berkiella aquae]
MIVLSTLILGKPVYEAEDKVSVTLAATFEKPIDAQGVKLKVTSSTSSEQFIIAPVIADAVDQFSEVSSSSSSDATEPLASHLHFTMPHLKCNEAYTYQITKEGHEIVMAGNEVFPDPIPHTPVQFKAPPLPGQAKHIHLVVSADQEVIDVARWTKLDEKLSTALGLQQNQKTLTEQIYHEIALKKPDVFAHLGDLFHGETYVPVTTVRTLPEFQQAIEEDFHQTVRGALSSTCSYRILDDHDFGENDASRAKYEKDPRAYDNAINAFNEFFPVPMIPEDGNRGLFYEATYGDVTMWCLNNRLFQGENGDLLGDAQFQWLAESLKKSTAKVKFIVSPLPFVMGKNPTEDYRGNDHVWDKVLNLAADARITGILCADSHNYSRTDIHVKNGDTETIIPQFLVGILGGKPQEISTEERKSLPKPLLPKLSADITTNYTDSEVKSYYTAIPKPGSHGKKISGMSLLPGKKKYRTFQDGKWIGENVEKSTYGFLDFDINLEEGKVFTQLFMMKQGGNKKPFFKDEATYPLQAERRKVKTF